LRALQLAQEMPQAVILQQGLVALGERGITLGKRRHKQRLQCVGIDRQLRWGVAHAHTESDSRAVVML
jgi:hypothetical protein